MLTIQEIRARYGGLPDLTDEQVVQRAYTALQRYYPDFQSFAKEVGYDPEWDFGRGLRIAGRNTLAAGAGAGAALASAVGATGVRDNLLDYAGTQSQRAVELGRTSDDVDNFFSDPGSFLAAGAGQAVGYAAPSLLAGGVGGLGLRGAAALGTRSMGGQLGAQAARQATMAGAAGGAYASNYAQATGGIYNELMEQGIDDPGRAAVYGAGVAALDTAPELLGVGRLMKGGVGGLRGAGRAALVQAGAEGATEAGQTAIERQAAYKPLLDDEAMKEYRNAAALGALGGGLFGGATGWRRSPQITNVDAPQTDLLQGERPDFALTNPTLPTDPDMQMPGMGAEVISADPRQINMFDPQGEPTYFADPSFGFGYGADAAANPTRDPTFAPAGTGLGTPGFQMEAFAPGGQTELFSYDQLPPGGPESVAAMPDEGAAPMADTATGDIFADRPTATVQTDFGSNNITRELRVANEGKTDSWLAKFSNALSGVITDPAKTAEFLENAQEDNVNSRASQATTARRDKVLAAARQVAQRFQSRMVGAQAQEGAARGRPGVRVGQQPASTTADDMRARNERDAFNEQLSSTDERVLASRRRGLLDAVLEDATTRNPLGRFTAMLKRNGLGATASAEEQQRISRYMDAKAGLTGQGQGQGQGEQLGERTLPTAEPNVPATEKAGRGPPKTQTELDFEGKATPAPAPAPAEPSYDGVAVELTVDAGGKTRKLKIADAGKKLRELQTKRDKYQQLFVCLTR
ncbi:MAG: hypothetical protein ACK54C_02130 [Betaproteobacteria bacterium]